MTSYLKVIKPMDVTLSATNATESTAAWNAGTNYAADALVSYDNRIWKSVVGANVGNTPSDLSAYWVNVRATNPYRCIDLKQTSTTTNTGSIDMTLVAGGIGDMVALLNVAAATVQVIVSEGGVETYNSGVIDLISSGNVYDAWSYTYAEIEYSYELYLPIPIFAGQEIQIILDASAGTAGLGEVIIGQSHTLGISTGDDVSLRDFSVKEFDEFGDAFIVERGYSFEHSMAFAFPKDDGRRVQQLLADLRATPSLYYAAENFNEYGASVFGWLDSWSTPLTDEGYVFATAEIKGLT